MISFLARHRKYTISFIISNETVSEMDINSHYHNALSGAYFQGELQPAYEYLEDLE